MLKKCKVKTYTKIELPETSIQPPASSEQPPWVLTGDLRQLFEEEELDNDEKIARNAEYEKYFTEPYDDYGWEDEY